PAFVAEYLQPYPLAARSIGEAALEAMRLEYSQAIARVAPSARYVTDKRPDNFLHIGLIKTLFPAARILHTVRNPLDVMVSTYFLNFAQSVAYSERLEDIAHYIGQYQKLTRHWERVFGDDIGVFDYDRFVLDGEAEIDRAHSWLGLDHAPPPISDDGNDGPVIRTPSAWQARAPVHARSSGRWRNFERQLQPFRYLLDR
ncbi:MAG: sulfotransferase family protein, partial [Erythrobacter sp.]